MRGLARSRSLSQIPLKLPQEHAQESLLEDERRTEWSHGQRG